MKTLFTSALTTLLFTIPTLAQEKVKSDSLVVLQIIDFKNGYEKEAFYNYYNDTIKNIEPLFFTIKESMNITEYTNSDNRLNEWLANYPEKEKVIKGDKKAVKKFYQATHDKFLDKYVNLATYPDIFAKGEYNCVSASILYGSLLKKLSIPFIVKVSTNHVFLIAFPSTTPTIIETTNPTVGTVIFTDKYKTDYVKQLRAQKLISEQEFKNNSIDELFYLNYFDCKTATFSALIGAQYYNNGLSLLSNQKFEEALPNLQKASLFMSSESSAGALTLATVGVIGLRKWDSDLIYSAYKQLVRLPDSLLKQEAIKSEIKHIASDRVIQNRDTTSFKRAYKAMLASTTKDDIKEHLHYVNNVAMSDYYMHKEEHSKAYPFLRDAYNADTTQKYFLFALCRTIENRFESEEPDEQFTVYQTAKKEIPDIATNSTFINAMARSIIKAVKRRTYAGQIEKADALLLEFEKQIPPSSLFYSSSIIDDTYGPLVKYYYAKRNNKKALQIVKRGLVYYPESYELGKMKTILTQ